MVGKKVELDLLGWKSVIFFLHYFIHFYYNNDIIKKGWGALGVTNHWILEKNRICKDVLGSAKCQREKELFFLFY